MNPNEGELVSCSASKMFTPEHEATEPLFFERDWDKNIDTCKCTDKPSEFVVFDRDGWTNCLKTARDEMVSESNFICDDF
jgi:hypothetical protein